MSTQPCVTEVQISFTVLCAACAVEHCFFFFLWHWCCEWSACNNEVINITFTTDGVINDEVIYSYISLYTGSRAEQQRNCGSIRGSIKILFTPKWVGSAWVSTQSSFSGYRGVEQHSTEVCYSPPYLFEVKNAWSYIAIFQYEEQSRRTY